MKSKRHAAAVNLSRQRRGFERTSAHRRPNVRTPGGLDLWPTYFVALPESESADLQSAVNEYACIAVINPWWRITTVNNRFCAQTGFRREELIGWDCRLFGAAQQPAAFYHHLRETLLRGAVWRGDLDLRSKDGSTMWSSTTIVPCMDRHKNLRRFVAIGVDVTAQKRMEQEIIQAQQREEQLRDELAHAMRVASIGEMAAALAHELNQPLAAIMSNAQAGRRFLADGVVDSQELAAIFDDIVRDDKRAGGVIHSLRAMIRKGPAERESCCLNELVSEVMELLHGEMVGAKIAVRPSLAAALPPIAVARVELQQVLVNLCINAIHAMRDSPAPIRCLEIATRSESDFVVVSIRDHGPGIPAERLESIFEPFHSTKPNGLGMGLSICRRIVENHGGRIEARNHEDGGASFRISLPARTPPRHKTKVR
jgi:PAS domain S-box-containing protein